MTGTIIIYLVRILATTIIPPSSAHLAIATTTITSVARGVLKSFKVAVGTVVMRRTTVEVTAVDTVGTVGMAATADMDMEGMALTRTGVTRDALLHDFMKI